MPSCGTGRGYGSVSTHSARTERPQMPALSWLSPRSAVGICSPGTEGRSWRRFRGRGGRAMPKAEEQREKRELDEEKLKLDEELDRQLEGTFPASDPLNV